MIFDFGNVLIGWDPETLYRKLIPDAAERKHFLAEICHGQWNALQDAGRSWEEAIAERIALHPDRADHIRAYRSRFAESPKATPSSTRSMRPASPATA
jgi:2-haloacid dehalogenase